MNRKINSFKNCKATVRRNKSGTWEKVLDSNKSIYVGVDSGMNENIKITTQPINKMNFSISTSLAPFTLLVFRLVH